MRSRPLYICAFLIFVSMVSLGPAVFTPRIYRSGDTISHFRSAYQYSAAIREGVLFPRWAAQSAFGLGEPGFVYYSPMFYYLTSLVTLAGIEVFSAMRMVALAANIAFGIAAFLIVRRFIDPLYATLAAVALQLSPFGYSLLFSNGSFTGYLGTAMIFVTLAAAIAAAANPRIFHPGLAISIALLTLTHVLSSFMILLTLPVLLLLPGRSWRRMVSLGVSASLGLGLASFFLVPAILCLKYITPAGWLEVAPDFDYSANFVFPFLLRTTWPTLQWYLPCLLLVMAVISRRRDAWFAVCCWCFLLSTPIAYPLWKSIKTIRMLQFPWRFLAVLFAAAIPALASSKAPKWLKVGPLAFSILLGIAYLFKMYVLAHPYTVFTMADVVGHPGLPEYRVAGSRNPAGYTFDAECAQKALLCREMDTKSHQRSWAIKATKSAVVRLPVYAYPAWNVTVDGNEGSVPDADGLLAVPLHAGDNLVALRWKRMPEERWGAMISAISVCVLAAGFFIRLRS